MVATNIYKGLISQTCREFLKLHKNKNQTASLRTSTNRKYSVSLIIREIQIKTKNKNLESVGKDV